MTLQVDQSIVLVFPKYKKQEVLRGERRQSRTYRVDLTLSSKKDDVVCAKYEDLCTPCFQTLMTWFQVDPPEDA